MKELVYIVFGFLLGTIPPWLARKRRLKAHWAALSAEIDICKEKGESYISQSIAAPLYRMPLDGYRHSYPVLLAEGALTEREVKTLSTFFAQAEDINRGLDRVAATEGDKKRMRNEFSRNCAKARELVEDVKGKASLYCGARDVVNKHLNQRWCHFKCGA